MLGLKPALALQASPQLQSAMSLGSQYAARANWVYGANAASAELLSAVTVSRASSVRFWTTGDGAARTAALSERKDANAEGVNIVEQKTRRPQVRGDGEGP